MIRRNEKKDMLEEAEKGSKGKFKMFYKKNAIIATSITRIQNQMNMNILSGRGRHTV